MVIGAQNAMSMTRLERAATIIKDKGWESVVVPTCGADNFKVKCNKKHTFSINVASVSNFVCCKICKKLDKASEKLHLLKQRIISSDLNNSDELIIECEFKHSFKRTIQNVILGAKPCPVCKKSKGTKNKFEKYNDYAKKLRGKLLTSEVGNSLSLCEWQCDAGHLFKTTPRRVKNGFWCLLCMKEEKLFHKKKEVKKIISSKNGNCFNLDQIKDLNDKFKVVCEKGHDWSVSSKSILNDRWCVKCQRIKYSLDDFKKIAIKKGGECLSELYQNSHQKLKFRCSKKHEWEAAVDGFIKPLKSGAGFLKDFII